MVSKDIIGGIGFDQIGSKLNRLTNQVLNLDPIPVDHISPRFGVGAEDKGLDHHGHAVSLAF
jgi:hypothetical protein